MKWFWVAVCILALYVTRDVAFASGTYSPPRAPKQLGVSVEQIEQGKQLFAGESLIGPSGQACASCHSAGKPNPLKRSNLKKKTKELANLINVCLTDKKRGAGTAFQLGDPQLIQLGTFLIAHYRLNKNDVQYLKVNKQSY
jgi:mono/diheme cytochrome c family protein